MVQVIIWTVLSLYLLRIFYLLVKLSTTTDLRISYLFSYLCTTEIIPLALGIHWILKG
jgi:hypothetical protein